MKNILPIIIAIILTSCNNSESESVTPIQKVNTFSIDWKNKYSSYTEEFAIIEIDSCEYLIGSYDRSRFVTHKGNCKYCINRKNIIK